MRGGELVTTNKPTVVSEPFLDTIVVEDSESDTCLPDPCCANESDRDEALCEINDIFDQFITSEAVPGRRGRQFSRG